MDAVFSMSVTMETMQAPGMGRNGQIQILSRVIEGEWFYMPLQRTPALPLNPKPEDA